MIPSIETLRGLKPKDLRALLLAGHPIDAGALDDTLYRGVSLGIPHWVESFAWTTFAKTFRREPAGLRGWNVKLEQTGLDGDVLAKRRRDGAPLTFGHYAVRTTPAPGLPAGTLLIDYGSPRNPALDPTRRLRDPLVALEPGDPTRLLGWTYVDAFGARIPTPSYFLLERWAELDHDA